MVVVAVVAVMVTMVPLLDFYFLIGIQVQNWLRR
jgi:hypothetical protein